MRGFMSVPFKAESGLSSVNGVAKFSPAGIVIEFESKLFGVIGGGVKEIQVPVGELLDVRFKRGFLKRGAKIEIKLKSFARLSELPNKDGKTTLKIAAEDFDRADAAVTELLRSFDEYESSLPPPRVEISSTFDDTEDETKKLK